MSRFEIWKKTIKPISKLCCILNTITTTQSFRKIYLSLYWKGCVWEGVGDQTELQHIDPHSIGHNRVSFPFFSAAQPGAWGPASLGAGFLYRILSPTRLISKLLIGGLRDPLAGRWPSLPHPVTNWLNFLCTVLYNSSTATLLLLGVTIALIQPIHGQGYNSNIPRPDAPVIFIGIFPILQPGRVVGQYTIQQRW